MNNKKYIELKLNDYDEVNFKLMKVEKKPNHKGFESLTLEQLSKISITLEQFKKLKTKDENIFLDIWNYGYIRKFGDTVLTCFISYNNICYPEYFQLNTSDIDKLIATKKLVIKLDDDNIKRQVTILENAQVYISKHKTHLKPFLNALNYLTINKKYSVIIDLCSDNEFYFTKTLNNCFIGNGGILPVTKDVTITKKINNKVEITKFKGIHYQIHT